MLVAHLREPVLDELLARPIHDLAQAQLYATTCHYLLHREGGQEELRRQGDPVLGVRPDKLPGGMVNPYLDLKHGGRL